MRYAPVACVSLVARSDAPRAVDCTRRSRTDQDKTLYALGLAIGNNIKDFNLTAAELALVTAGLSDAVLGKRAEGRLRGVFGRASKRLRRSACRPRRRARSRRRTRSSRRCRSEPGAERSASG